MNEATESVIKGGETMISLGIKRAARNGLIVSARVHPIFEEFFREQANERLPADEFARQWFPLKDQPPLEVWHILHDPGVVRGNMASYRINLPGSPLFTNDGNGKVINLSFLRLVGASDPNGISFEIKGAFTLTYIRQLASDIGSAVKQFYIDCLKPVNIMMRLNQPQEGPAELVSQENR